MNVRKLVAAALVLAVLAVPAYARKKKKKDTPAEASTATAPASTGEVAAYIGDQVITVKELEEASSRDLMRIRQQEYAILSRALDGMISQRLLEKEAEARGMSLAEMLTTEVDSKVVDPTDEQLSQFYKANQARYRGRPFEDVSPEIQRVLRAQKTAALRKSFIDGIRQKASVRVLLDPPRTEVPIPPGEPSIGPDDAPVTIVEFSDFQCPFCKRAHPTVETLLEEYGGKIRFVYRDYPLAMHKRAFPASQAARCATEQDKYWDYHRNLMKVAGNLSDADLSKRAGDLGLDVAAFEACYASNRYDGAIKQGFDEGASIGVTGTPAFFINGRMLVGAKPITEFREIIDDELERAGSAGEPDGE